MPAANLFLIALLGLTAASSVAGQCIGFTLQDMPLFGGAILASHAHQHSNISVIAPAEQNHYTKNITGLDVCEVVVTYTDIGYNDVINTIVWLPPAEHWFLCAGGSEWVTGADNTTLSWATNEGFVVVTTDGGHAADVAIDDWVLVRPGNVN